MNNKSLWIGLGLVIAVFLVGAYLMRGSSTPTNTPASNLVPAPGSEGVEEAVVTGEEVMEKDGEAMADTVDVVVEGEAFKFTPSTLTFNQGDKVRLTFKNTGGTHDFVVDELSLATQRISTDEEETLEFTVPNTPGTYSFYCSVGNHRALGMEGTLTIK